MLIGLSLSYCISDIINGRVDKNDVMFIVAGTRIMCDHDLDSVLENYAKYEWQTDPERGMAIAREFYNRGMIIQPRVLNCNPPHVAEGWWAKVGREI
jgi:hypothetical protein